MTYSRKKLFSWENRCHFVGKSLINWVDLSNSFGADSSFITQVTISPLSERAPSTVKLNWWFATWSWFKGIKNSWWHFVLRGNFEKRIDHSTIMIWINLNRILLLMLSCHLFYLYSIDWLCLIELIITVVCKYLLVIVCSRNLTGLPLVGCLIPHRRAKWLLADSRSWYIRPHALICIVSLVLRYLRALYLNYP